MITTFEEYFTKRNPEQAFIVRYMKEALEQTTLNFSDVTSFNLRIFKDYVMNKVSANSAKRYFSVVKATCRELINDNIITNERCLDVLKVKNIPSENVFCTEEEIARMDAYFDYLVDNNGRQSEIDCLCLFLVENVTGARASDCKDFTQNNISNGKLSYISKKTRQKSVMPVHRNLLKYLKYIPKREYCRASKNRIIKRIAKKCGITEEVTLFYRGKQVTGPKYMFIGTHTGRRDFATHLAMRNAPITEICQFMNHRKNISQTMRYIMQDTKQVSNESMDYFNKIQFDVAVPNNPNETQAVESKAYTALPSY